MACALGAQMITVCTYFSYLWPAEHHFNFQINVIKVKHKRK